jgi:hypothetical protein
MPKIDKDSFLSDILQKEGAQEILSRHRVPCLTCPMAQMEMKTLKIGDICKMYGLDEKKLLLELNKE